jgi:hypothetical protein
MCPQRAAVSESIADRSALLAHGSILDRLTRKNMFPTSTNSASADQEFIEFAQEVFKLARTGDAQTLARLLQKGLPPNMSNHKGDTLLMLAAYHGQVEATRVLLEAGAEADRYNDMAQTPLGRIHLQGPPADRRASAVSWRAAGFRAAGRKNAFDVRGHVQPDRDREGAADERRRHRCEELGRVVRAGTGPQHGSG